MLLGFLGSLDARTDVDIPQRRQPLSELLHVRLVRLDLLALGILGAALLLRVEPQVLEQDDLSAAGLVHCLLYLRTYAVFTKDDRFTQQLLELRDDGCEAVFWVWLAIRTAEVGH